MNQTMATPNGSGHFSSIRAPDETCERHIQTLEAAMRWYRIHWTSTLILDQGPFLDMLSLPLPTTLIRQRHRDNRPTDRR